MILTTCVTETHIYLLKDHFLDSLAFEEGLHLVVARLKDSFCPSGKFGSEGWSKVCSEKMWSVYRATSSNEEIIVYSDCDVRFYGKIKSDIEECLSELDIAFINEGNNTYGCGFFAFKNKPSVQGLLRDVARNSELHRDDQECLNVEIQNARNKVIRHGFLPERYWTHGKLQGRYTVDMELNPPKDILVHHANFCVGIEDKIDLLYRVRNML